MSSTLLQSLVAVHSVEPAPRRLSSDTTALRQTQSAAPHTPAKDTELLRPLPTRHTADGVMPSAAIGRHDDLEMSCPGTPDTPADMATVVPTVWEPYMNRWRLLLTCTTALAEGMSDSAAGALLPYMEKSAPPQQCRFYLLQNTG